MTKYCCCYLLFSRHWNQGTSEKTSQFGQHPNHWHFCEMALLKGKWHSIHILRSPRHEDLLQRSTNIFFLLANFGCRWWLWGLLYSFVVFWKYYWSMTHSFILSQKNTKQFTKIHISVIPLLQKILLTINGNSTS